jgi:hypothetical protein
MMKYLDVEAMRLQKLSSCGRVKVKTAREAVLIETKSKNKIKKERIKCQGR